ncbi:MAG: integrase arm-type DNA-binding domain-containing protein [Desulfobacteraceae bacterium]|nr:integrase arm-type DNA-binding domain-containing protein [Desulfobacteraceae bacterium]
MPKQIVPLTDAKIKAAKPKNAEYKIFDGGGLYVLVTPSGGKLWRLKYRAGGKEKKLAIGSYPEVSLAEARHKRDQARTYLASGTDPAEVKKKEKAKADGTNSFETVAREWHDRFKAEWSIGHAEAVLARLSRDVFPHMGTRQMDEITPPEILAALRRIEERSLETAHRIKITCGQIYRYAIATGKATYNPVDALRGALPTVKQNHGSPHQSQRNCAHFAHDRRLYRVFHSGMCSEASPVGIC